MTLEDTIAWHRAAYKDDTHISRLVQRQPPTTLDLNTGTLHQEPAAAVGMTMSARLLKYVSHPEGYGADFPWSKALWNLRGWCRKEHRRRYHSVELHWDGSLCHQMVKFVVIREWSVPNAAAILDYDDPEPILRDAFAYMEQRIDDFRRQAERRERELEGHGPGAIPAPVHEHRALPGLHETDCIQCRKRLDAA
jgi:hypothetical protein